MTSPITSSRRARPRWAAGTLIAALALAGCSTNAGESAGSDIAADEPVDGGSVTLALDGDPSCIDPAQTSLTNTLSLGAQFTDTLVDQDFDSGEIVPYLAESWEINDAATEFTFHLRDGVTFSDGTPLDAAAVKANFDGVIGLGAASFLGSTYLSGYVETRVVDDSTVTVVFSEGNVPFLQASATATLGILSPETNAKTAEERCRGELVGSGPFVLSEYELTSRVVLTKRDGYDWPSATASHEGEAHLDEVVLPIVAESSVRTGGLQSGEFDGIFQVAVQDQDVLEAAGYGLISRPNPGNVSALFANTFRPLVADEAVRKAVQKAIDREEFQIALANDRYVIPTSVLSETTPGYVDLSDELTYDPEAAAQLLDDAGWAEGDDGIRERDGVRLSLTLFAGSWAQSAAELTQTQLKRVGIDSEIVVPELSQSFQLRSEGDWDYSFSGLTRADPDTLRRDYWSGGQPNSAAHIAPNPIDDLLLAQKEETDVDARYGIVAEAQKALLEEGYSVPYQTNLQIYGVVDTLHDLRLDASSRLRLYDAWTSAQS
ncbi:ABC transporter substrate-binding protein [Microbacterium trichothecenolyticum]|uniref:ABC transporter substrate-binding protein n=1 Tax=Microbacterium trichothecenolyticum TaxID=69370 RepID=UPI001C6F3956|nr:ABC transporter substrate-binding protein [Microbacterium trichothecenolyticum]MBW9121902.1 ABC transporter substrate-binding protein [Microbacterium trichothecenolyticum]